MYLDTEVAASVNMMEIQPGEKFFVCKYYVDSEMSRPAWSVWLAPETEKARAVREEPELERQLRESIALEQRKNGHAKSTPASRPVLVQEADSRVDRSDGVATDPPATELPTMLHLGWAQSLLSQSQALIDVQAAALDYAGKRYGAALKAEDVRSLVITAFINLSHKGGKGGSNVA